MSIISRCPRCIRGSFSHGRCINCGQEQGQPVLQRPGAEDKLVKVWKKNPVK